MGWRHGRHRSPRCIDHYPNITLFKPAGAPMRDLDVIEISFAEVEAIRLSDIEGLTQEEAASRMGISRRSFWSDLTNARKKVAVALTRGCAIRIVSGSSGRQVTKSNEEKEE